MKDEKAKEEGLFGRFFKKIANFLNSPISKLDWVIFFVIAFFCYITFLHGDILGVNASSISYLAGHIKDFYDYNAYNKTEYMCNYLPTTYILFAIWNIPTYILNLVRCPQYPVTDVRLVVYFWYKLLPVIFYFAGAVVFYKICEVLGFGFKKCKILIFIYLTTPIAFFSPLIFGQYDSFTVFFVLLGLYFYFKKNLVRFAIFFGIAITFKYFALLIFLPLLLFMEKKVLKIFQYFFVCAAPFVVECLFYLDSPGFRRGVFGFQVASYVFQEKLNLIYVAPSLFLILWVFVLAWAYIKKIDFINEDFSKWAIYLCNVVCFLIFGICMWHPQWLIFMVPFAVLGSAVNKNAKSFFVMDSVLFLLLSLFCVALNKNNVDEILMYKGFLRRFLNYELTTSMGDVLIVGNIKNVCNFIFACFSALLLAGAVFKHPKFSKKIDETDLGYFNLTLRFRMFAVVLFWILPSLLCIVFSVVDGKRFAVRNTLTVTSAGHIGNLDENSKVEQYFNIPKDFSYLEELRVTFHKSGENKALNLDSEFKVRVDIEDVVDRKVIFSKEYDGHSLKNELITKLYVGKIKVNPNHQHRVKFRVIKFNPGVFVSIIKQQDNNDYCLFKPIEKKSNGDFAVVGGEKKNYNLNLDVLGR